MSNTANSIALLTSLKTFLTNLESDNLRTGSAEIDLQTRAIITTRIDQFCAAVFDGGSRAMQNATAAARAAASGGAVPAQDPIYKALDDFVKSIDAQVAILNNPTQTPRRSHSTLQ